MSVKRSVNNLSQIRIIGGEFRSRNIIFPDLPEIRPTPNRVRETLFNWLAPYIQGARCLDLFAGSGALTFEALSRGASYCLSLDNSSDVITFLEKNKEKFHIESALQITQASFPYDLKNLPKFDIVFVDPPFLSDFVPQVLPWLMSNALIDDNSLIYIESSKKNDILKNIQDWQVVKDKIAGDVRYTLIRHSSH